MTHQEVKRILRSCRHGGRDCDDPLFKEALAEVKRDPVLAQWYGQEQDLDRCIAQKLQASTPTPSEYRTKLVAARARKRAHPHNPWRRHAWISMTAAGCFAALAMTALFWVQSPRLHAFDLAEFREAMIHDVNIMGSHGRLETGDLQWVLHRLAEHGVDPSLALPVGLHDLPEGACRVFNWNGRKVSLIRFLLDGARHVDLFVVDPAGVWGTLLLPEPQFAGSDQLRTASWRSGSKVFLVTGSGTEAELRRVLWSQLPHAPDI